MNLKMIVAIVVILPYRCAPKAQKPSAAKVTNVDAQKVVKMISGDKARPRPIVNLVKLA